MYKKIQNSEPNAKRRAIVIKKNQKNKTKATFEEKKFTIEEKDIQMKMEDHMKHNIIKITVEENEWNVIDQIDVNFNVDKTIYTIDEEMIKYVDEYIKMREQYPKIAPRRYNCDVNSTYIVYSLNKDKKTVYAETKKDNILEAIRNMIYFYSIGDKKNVIAKEFDGNPHNIKIQAIVCARKKFGKKTKNRLIDLYKIRTQNYKKHIKEKGDKENGENEYIIKEYSDNECSNNEYTENEYTENENYDNVSEDNVYCENDVLNKVLFNLSI